MVKDLCFEIIETCLNNCVFCSSNSNCHKKRIISFEDYKRVIDHFMKNGGIEELSLSGGEPFLHPELLKMVAYAKSQGIRTVIFTSGVTRGKEITESEKEESTSRMKDQLAEATKEEPENVFLRNSISNFYNELLETPPVAAISKEDFIALREAGIDKIVFDYQAYEYDTDHKIMGRTEQYRQALLKSLITASLLGIDVDVHFVPMKPNYQEIGDILEMLEIAEVKNISILNFLPQGRGKQNASSLQLTTEELQIFFKKLEEAQQKYSGMVRIGIPLQGETSHKCNAGLEKLDIKFDGTVLPCPAFKEITPEECARFNIKLPNIFGNLEDIVIPGKGTRAKPLCKQIYSARNSQQNIV